MKFTALIFALLLSTNANASREDDFRNARFCDSVGQVGIVAYRAKEAGESIEDMTRKVHDAVPNAKERQVHVLLGAIAYAYTEATSQKDAFSIARIRCLDY